MDTSLLLTFHETGPFAKQWANCGLTDYDLAQLQWTIIDNPKAGAVVTGTGGFRKLRFAPEGMGKSGAFRVLYLVVPAYGAVALAMVFGKTDLSNIGEGGKKAFAKLAQAFESSLKLRKA